MKKVLAIMLSLVLAVSFCMPAFAAETTTTADATGTTAAAGFDISQILNKLPPQVKDAVQGIIDKVTSGSMPKPEDMKPEAIKAKLDKFLTTDASGNDYKDAEGNVIVNPDKVAEVFTKLENLDYPAIKSALDAMKKAGMISDMAYAALMAEADRISSVDASVEQSRIDAGGEPTTKPIDGIKHFFGDIFGGVSGLLGGLLGGGSGSGDSGSIGGGSANDESFENTKTGDIALFSVAGAALVAGVALALTKKKDN